MSTRVEDGILLPATVLEADDTWIECPGTITMDAGAGQVRLNILVEDAEVGDLKFKIQTRGIDGQQWCWMVGAGAIWTAERMQADDCIWLPLSGAGLCTRDEFKVWYKADSGAGAATLTIAALAYEGHPWSGSALESNGASPVNIQDQTTSPLDAKFAQQLSAFTLAADTVPSGQTSIVRTFPVNPGSGILAGDEIFLFDVAGDIAMFSEVLSNVADTITVDRPVDHVFPALTTLGQIVNTNMAIDGSIDEQFFTLRAGTSPVDVTRYLTSMILSSSGDDSRFGNLPALTRGVLLRIYNGTKRTVFNFKTNGDIKNFCYDVAYSDKAAAGQYGLSSRITYGGPSKHGVVQRISGTEVIQWIAQDDLTALITYTNVAQGHNVFN